MIFYCIMVYSWLFRRIWGLTDIMKWAFWDDLSWMFYEPYELYVWEKIKFISSMLHTFSDGFSISIQARELREIKSRLISCGSRKSATNIGLET